MQATISQVQWVIESYALFLSALMLTGGALGDLYGQRQIFTLGNILFAAGSAACGLSPNISLLIAAVVCMELEARFLFLEALR